MYKRTLLRIASFAAKALIVAQPVAYAQTAKPPKIDIKNADDLVVKVLCPIIDVMFAVLMAVSVIMVIWAAYVYLTAQGDEEKIKKGHKTITYAGIAIVVALLAKGFPFIVASIFSTDLSGGSCGF